MFHEVQRFRQKWIWILMVVTAGTTIPFLYGFMKQIVFGQPWGNRPLSDTGLLVTLLPAMLIGLGIPYLFYVLKLETKITDDGIYVRFYPLRSKIIPYETIENCQARTYRPIREYGGWGIRYGGKNGKAYNVSGNKGVQLVFKNGKRLLIGSNRSEELAKAINSNRNPG